MDTQVLLFFLAIHIVSAGIWVSQFVAEFALGRVAQSLKGKTGQAIAVLGEARVASLLGMIGGIGILISGLILTYGYGYGILGIAGVNTPIWLAIKQVIFIIAMGLLGALVTRPMRQVLPQVMQAINSGQLLSAETEAVLNRVTMISRIINLLVLINIFLGVYGVNGGFHP